MDNPDAIFNVLAPDVTDDKQAFAKGEAALAQGKTNDALFYYSKTLQLNKKNIKALERIAAIQIQNKQPELALNAYKDILTIDSQNVPANEYIGLFFLENGQLGKAKDHLNAVIKNSNGNWKAHNGLGVIADLAHSTNEAIAHYQAALALEPTNPMLLNNLGYSYYLAGDEIKAKSLFTQALNYDTKYERAIHNLALIYIKDGNISKAVSLFNRIMPVFDSYNNIGYISMLNGQYGLAEEYLRKAIDESPVYFPKAQENLKTLLSLKPKLFHLNPSIDPQSTDGTEIVPKTSLNLTPSQSETIQSETHGNDIKVNGEKDNVNHQKTNRNYKKKHSQSSKQTAASLLPFFLYKRP